MLQQPASVVLEEAISAYIKAMPPADRELLESFANRAGQSLVYQSARGANGDTMSLKTVTGKEFVCRDLDDGGMEVLFENSQPLKITGESIGRILQEIKGRKGPALMGAIYSPLMPQSIGEAIQQKYKLSPINLSYVVPLLCKRNEIRAYKNGRNWYVQGAH